MEPFVAFKYLHIVSMFFAVALVVSTELVLRRVAGSGELGPSRRRWRGSAHSVTSRASCSLPVSRSASWQPSPGR